MSKFKVGDIVIPNSGAFEGTKCKINKHVSEGHYVVESLIPLESRGHKARGVFDTNRGWGYYEKDLELVEPVEDTITIRLLTEQEFKHRGLWDELGDCPYTWVLGMNVYLGKTITLASSKIRSDGCFIYDDWRFEKNNYEIVTPSIKDTVTVPQPEVKSEVESKPEAKFKKGDRIIPNCYPFWDTPCEVIEDLDYEGDYLIKSLRLNEDRGDLNDDRSCVSFTSLRKATLVTEESKSELELAKEQFPIGCYVKPNTGPFNNIVCKVVYHHNTASDNECIGVEGPAMPAAHNCGGHAKKDSGWYYKVSEIVKIDPPKEEPVQACKFKVGDTVTYVGSIYELKGQIAKVVATSDSNPEYFIDILEDLAIEFTKDFFNAHQCYRGGKLIVPSGKGRLVSESDVILATYTEEPKSEPKSKFQIGDTVIYNGCVSNLKSKVFTVTHIIFGPFITYSIKAVDSYFHYDIAESSLEKYNPFESATSVVSTEWIPTTKLINPKTKVNLSPELEYHQQPQIIKKPIKKSLITI